MPVVLRLGIAADVVLTPPDAAQQANPCGPVGVRAQDDLLRLLRRAPVTGVPRYVASWLSRCRTGLATVGKGAGRCPWRLRCRFKAACCWHCRAPPLPSSTHREAAPGWRTVNPLASRAALCRDQSVPHPADGCVELRQIVVDRGLDDLRVGGEVVMREHVSHPRDLSPRDFWFRRCDLALSVLTASPVSRSPHGDSVHDDALRQGAVLHVGPDSGDCVGDVGQQIEI